MIWIGISISSYSQTIISEIMFRGANHSYIQDKLSNVNLANKVGEPITETRLESDLKQIYLTGVVQSVAYELEQTPFGLILAYTITPNPIPTDIRFKNRLSFSNRRLKTHLRTEPGLPINTHRINRDKDALTDFYHTSGYDMFRIEAIEFTPSKNIEFILDEGIIKSINYTGLNKIKPFVIKRNMRQKKGIPYNRKALLEDRQRLLNLGYFYEINNSFLERSVDGVNINLDFKERKSNLLNIGLEQDRNDVVAFIQTKKNHFLMHSDYIIAKTQIEFQPDTRFKSYLFSYHQPWLMNHYPMFMTVNVIDEFRTDPLNQQFLQNERIGGDVTLGKPFFDDTYLISTTFRKNHVKPVTAGEFEAYVVTSILWSLSSRRVNDLLNPTHGVYWQIDYEKSGNILGINAEGVEFDRTNIQGAIFYNWKPKHVLAFHSLYGQVNQITPSFNGENYSLGGANSLRGYASNSFFGSRRLLVNMEYRYTINTVFQTVFFHDMGSIYEDHQSPFTTVRHGSGIGVRYLTPVGPIRLDFAWGDDFFIHFNVGHVF